MMWRLRLCVLVYTGLKVRAGKIMVVAGEEGGGGSRYRYPDPDFT